MTPWAAKCAACWDEPHWRSTVVAGHRLGPAGGEDGVAADVDALLADLHDAAHDHVVDESGIEVVALDERLEHLGGQVGGMPAAELPVALATGGADGIDDDGIGHGDLAYGGMDDRSG